MDNVIIEQLIDHSPTKEDRKRRYIYLIVTAVFVFIWLCLPNILAIIFMEVLTVACAALLMNFFLNKEYEYTFVDGDLDIDVIYNKSRRRRVFTGSVQEFEIIAHFTDKENLDFYKNYKLKDFSGGLVNDNTYVFAASYKGKKARFVIEPNDNLLEALRQSTVPTKFFKLKKTEDKL
ncbi:MAG: hypothetical protein LUD81_06845 [Clostridiales bacterium]|nr:hypothetical protein [Clostridiales bacterium]